MWRANPKHSKRIVIRRFTFDEDDVDEYGRPTATQTDVCKVVEIYPYSDVMKRELVGITSENSYAVIMDRISLKADDVVVMDGEIYRIHSISPYEPMQLIISSKGEADGSI